MKPLFTHDPSLNVRLLLVCITSVVLFFADTRFHYFAPVKTVLLTVAYPIHSIAALPEEIKLWTLDFFQERRQLRQRNTVLETNELLNNVRLQKLNALERENMRLRALLGSSFRLNERVTVAEVLTIDLDPFSQQIVIDKGKQQGVFVGQPVLDASGVMGQVTDVTPFSSRVILLTDPSHAIPVQLIRNDLRAIVIGRGMGESLHLEYLPHSADVRVGDLVVTSGLGGRFPYGYPVGKVSSISYPEGEAFAVIELKPAAHLETSREVLLVQTSDKEQNEPDSVDREQQ